MIAIYARQSIDKKDSLSIDGQIELCRRECGGNPRVYADRGYSGKNTDRPAFRKMMAAVERGEIEKIVVYRLDRISRSITDFGRIWEILKKHRSEFISVNERFDTSTPVGRAMVYIILVFAQLERETIAERIRDNYNQRARRGVFAGGPAPFGFSIRRTSLGGKTASALEANERMKTVKEIFEKYAYTDDSLGKIAAGLTKQGIPGIGRKAWDSVALSRILHNPAYVRADADVYCYYRSKGIIPVSEVSEFTGEKSLFLWGKRDRGAKKDADPQGQFLAISEHSGAIDSRTFLACQRKLDENRQIRNGGKGKYTWLSGLVKCTRCGYSLRVISAKGRLYFCCSGRSNYHVCELRHTESVGEIEGEAARLIQAELDRLAAVPVKEEPDGTHNAEKMEAIQVGRQIERLVDRLEEADGVAMTYINERIASLDVRRKSLMKAVRSGRKKPAAPIWDVPFADLDFDAKKAVARELISRIEASPERVKIVLK